MDSTQVAHEQSDALARHFHEAYERLAPAFGYKTREASAKPWAEVPEQNKRLMVAVCAEMQHRALLIPMTLLFPLPGEVVLTIPAEGVIGETTTRVRHAKQFSNERFLVTTHEWKEIWITRTEPGIWQEVAP